MKQLLKSAAVGVLGLANAYPTRLTHADALRALIQKLLPMATDRALIRLGPKGDGGYLIPDDLAGIEALFSPGVSFLSGFEKDCADLGIKIFLADKSVERPAESHDLFSFTKKFLGATTNDDFITLDGWVHASLPGSRSDLLLQADIEGYEYELFLSASDHLMQRFRIIVAEFHHLDQLWSQPFFQLASRAFEKILQTHTCIHIHPNNYSAPLRRAGFVIPEMAEFTFLRHDRVSNASYATEFPHPLDFDNTPKAHLPLPACWYHRPS